MDQYVTGAVIKSLREKSRMTQVELAEKLNIPADNLKASVERYNELCAKGVDEDYGKSPHRMTPVDTAPFYGVRTCAWHLTTMDGCRINTDMQVITHPNLLFLL